MKSFILSLILGLTYMQCVVAQDDDQSVVASNEYLTMQTENADNDVTKINVLNAITQTKTATDDLQEIINALGVATSYAEGAPSTNEDGEEENIEESFSQFTDALIALARDLLSKKTYFKANLRESTVYNDIQSIRTGLLKYVATVDGLIDNPDIRDDISESAEGAYSELGTTETEFEN